MYSPSWIPGFSAALDWFSIKVQNRISAVGATFTVQQCYQYGIQSYCDKIQRDDWNMGNWSSTLGGRYYSGIKDRCWTKTEECSNPTDVATFGTGVNRLSGDFFFDLSIGYKLPWNAKIMAGANNLFDKKPRVVYSASSSYNGTSSSSAVDPDRPISRFFYVRYNQSF